jgi:hypothetical protein
MKLQFRDGRRQDAVLAFDARRVSPLTPNLSPNFAPLILNTPLIYSALFRLATDVGCGKNVKFRPENRSETTQDNSEGPQLGARSRASLSVIGSDTNEP